MQVSLLSPSSIEKFPLSGPVNLLAVGPYKPIEKCSLYFFIPGGGFTAQEIWRGPESPDITILESKNIAPKVPKFVLPVRSIILFKPWDSCFIL